VTAAVVTFVWQARPEILERTAAGKTLGGISTKKVVTGIVVAALIVGGFVSWFASANPDGLEWAMERTAGTAELEGSSRVHDLMADLQSKTAILPDYGFKTADEADETSNAGTTVSGIVGGALTLGLAGLIGLIISVWKKKKLKIA
jgi:cobalt/nickel transport system permease protein